MSLHGVQRNPQLIGDALVTPAQRQRRDVHCLQLAPRASHLQYHRLRTGPTNSSPAPDWPCRPIAPLFAVYQLNSHPPV